MKKPFVFPLAVIALLFAAPAHALGPDADGRTPVTVSAMPGDCVGANLTTTSSSVTLQTGVTYRVIALTDLWLRLGATATADAPSEFYSARTARIYTFAGSGAAPVVHGILPAGAIVLAGAEVLFCPMRKVQ